MSEVGPGSEPDAGRLTWFVPDMTSAGSVRAVTAVVLDLPGVQWVQADRTSGLLVVQGTARAGLVRQALLQAGFRAVGVP